MTDNPRETAVLDAVVTLVDSLLDDFDVVDLLTDLTERCVELLDVAAAGLLLADPLQQLRLLAATSEQARELELFQLQADEGPCVDCYTTGQPVSVADLRRRRHAVAAVRSRRPRRRLRLGARRPDARRRHRAGRARPVRHPARRAQRGRSARRPDAGPHRVRGDPAGTPAHTVDRDAAAALRAGQPRRRRAGQGLPPRTPRRVGRGGVPAVADLRPRPAVNTSPTSPGG